MCVFRLSVIFLDRQFSNELASLDTHPRRSLSALLIPFCCIVFYVFIHVRCDSHMSLVMRSSFQVCLPPCMCIWNTDLYVVFLFLPSEICNTSSLPAMNFYPHVLSLSARHCVSCIVELFSHSVRMCTCVCVRSCLCDSYLLQGESNRIQHSIPWPCCFVGFWCVRWQQSTKPR